MPSVVGKQEEIARQWLREAGFHVHITRQRAPEDRDDEGDRRRRACGRPALPGSTVTLVVSKGPESSPTNDVTASPTTGTLKVEPGPSTCAIWVYVDKAATAGQCPRTLTLSSGHHTIMLWDTTHRVSRSVSVEVKAGQTQAILGQMHDPRP